jgi:hypothetical protein
MRSQRDPEMEGATLNGALIDWDAIENNQWAHAKQWAVLGAGCTCEPWAHWTGYNTPAEGYGFSVHLHHEDDCRFQRVLARGMN